MRRDGGTTRDNPAAASMTRRRNQGQGDRRRGHMQQSHRHRRRRADHRRRRHSLRAGGQRQARARALQRSAQGAGAGQQPRTRGGQGQGRAHQRPHPQRRCRAKQRPAGQRLPVRDAGLACVRLRPRHRDAWLQPERSEQGIDGRVGRDRDRRCLPLPDGARRPAEIFDAVRPAGARPAGCLRLRQPAAAGQHRRVGAGGGARHLDGARAGAEGEDHPGRGQLEQSRRPVRGRAEGRRAGGGRGRRPGEQQLGRRRVLG